MGTSEARVVRDAAGIAHLSTEQSIYDDSDERYVVLLGASYPDSATDPDIGVDSPKDAAYWALQLTRDKGWTDTHWYVLDRQTGIVHVYEQGEIEANRD
jgi:hypothetical protein